MTKLYLTNVDPTSVTTEALIIGIHHISDEADSPLALAGETDSIVAAFHDKNVDLCHTLASLGATGTTGEVTKMATFGAIAAPVLVAVGLGKSTNTNVPTTILRQVCASATRACAGISDVTFALPLDPEKTSRSVRAIAEGGLTGTYRFSGYRSKPVVGHRAPVGSIALHVSDTSAPDLVAEISRALTVTSAADQARDWVNTAPNEQRPPQFAQAIAQAATAAGLEVDILDRHALEEGGFGGILAVGGGSSQPPSLVRLTYRPQESTTTIALVGKGVTFDSGGLSIKPSQGMWEMKSDMAGAAAVAATMLAVATLSPSATITAYLPLAENMPSGSAYRPGDVIKMRNGKYVEVLNTDAEGRLILADAICLACESKPNYLLEVSTLTGGQVVALGTKVSGVMGTPALCEKITLAGDRAGEPVWPMPLPEDIRTGMDSDVADICHVNSSMDRSGHMLQGGIFLSEFVSDTIPWAHIDIAGPSYNTKDSSGDWHKGATGVPVRTLLEVVEDLAG